MGKQQTGATSVGPDDVIKTGKMALCKFRMMIKRLEISISFRSKRLDDKEVSTEVEVLLHQLQGALVCVDAIVAGLFRQFRPK